MSSDVFDLYRRHLGEGLGRVAAMLNTPLEVGATGAVVHTADGRQLVNCAGYGVFLVGAGHPAVRAAVHEQIDRQALSTRVLLNEPAARAAEALTSVAPEGLVKVHFSTSGAEAVETAIKIARANGRHRLVSMHSGYHGKTTGALSLTARSLYQDPFRPLLPEVVHVRFGDLDELAAVVDRDVCVVVEPVQSEGGVIIPAPGYLKAVEELCRDRGAMLVLDEVMTGLGRLGTWWGADRDGVRPDILLVGKALSGGLVPVAATLATAAAFAPLDKDPYLHTSTFSAAPIAMAAVRATVGVIRDEGLVDRAGALGARLLAALTEAAGVIGHLVAEVRGVGLLIGVEFRAGHHAAEFLMDLLDNDVVVNHSMNAHPVLRLTPPATMTPAEEARLVASFARACAALAARFPAATTGPAA
ncbi:putrescine aminotransferase [Micromonospora echinospora]|uniref:Putrescine aminotransferase n=1 Tax=Micromonospora echinospora TaxID=1877 RepID=A0A1C4Z5R2_MICEC|nr:aminotransferase class III-fold pyridoxal phosphate-dependent enzyme [Micromonospora echinospora]SCF28318.1 putrescine aminotransferase [Micromonospora echinospora]